MFDGVHVAGVIPTPKAVQATVVGNQAQTGPLVTVQ